MKSGFQESNDPSLQFLHWLNRAAAFNKEMKGKQMTEVNEEIRLAVLRGRVDERQRIKERIMDRVTDLKNCSDDDDCHLFGEFIGYYIPEWLGEEE